MKRRCHLPIVSSLLVLFCASSLVGQCVIELPPAHQAQHVMIELPEGLVPSSDGSDLSQSAWTFVDVSRTDRQVPAQVTHSLRDNGAPDASRFRVIASFPPGGESGSPARFRLERSERAAESNFRWNEGIGNTSIELYEGDTTLYRYNYGTITDPKVPDKDGLNTRACYIHPVWGLSGEVLTDDFPQDHYHHHGIFWTWPYVKVGDQTYDLWMSTDIRQRFVRWLTREAGPAAAVLGVENGWFVADRQVATERVWIRAFHSEAESRTFDVTLVIEAGDKPITLQGRQEKSYGGLTFRFDVWPRTDAQVRIPGKILGRGGDAAAPEQDLLNTPLPWADLSSTFSDAHMRSGAAVFIHPRHPDYPPTWLTRTYGALCVGWPGVKPYTIDAGKSVQLDYRIWIHKAEPTPDEIDRVYQGYVESTTRRAE